MKKGINYWSFAPGTTAEEAVTLAAAAGYRGLEFCLAAEGDVALTTSERRLKEIRHLAEDAGVDLPSLASWLVWENNLVSDDAPVRARSDLRLLAPALVAWAIAAGALGLSTSGHLAIAALSSLALLALWGWAVRRGRSAAASGMVWVAALALALVVLLQVAAGAQSSLRARGGVLEWAHDRAAVTAEVVVTGDPIEVASTGDEPRLLLEGTARVLEVRGRRHEVSAPLLLTGGPELASLRWRQVVAACPRSWPRRGRSRAGRSGFGRGCAPRWTERPLTPAVCCPAWSSATRHARRRTSPPPCVPPA